MSNHLGDCSPTFSNASNLFSRCVGGGRISTFSILVIALSEEGAATVAICDNRDNLMPPVPLGLTPCLCVDQLWLVSLHSVWPFEEH